MDDHQDADRTAPVEDDSFECVPCGDDVLGEKAPVLKKRAPPTPSRQEVADHEVDHYPYRSWCRSCVASAGRRDAHKSDAGETEDDSVAVITCDYGFFTDGVGELSAAEQEKYAPILVMRDKGLGMVFADVVHHKGVDPHAVKQMVDHSLYLGHPVIRLRSDGEPAIKALLAVVAAELKKHNVRVVPDQTPKGDSQAGGLQETTVKAVKDKVRCIWHQACELHGVPAGLKHLVLAWCVRYAAQLLSRNVVGKDGKTAWRRHTGRYQFPRPLMPWGEKVWFIEGGAKMKPGDQQAKWTEGIFLALVDRTSEYIIGTPAGCVKSNNAKRMQTGDAKDGELFKSIQGMPWRMHPTLVGGVAQEDLPTRAMAIQPQVVPDADLPPRHSMDRASGPRRVYIRKDVELDRYGKTDFCPGCTAAEAGTRAQPHTEECRGRIMEAMREDNERGGAQRVNASERRLVEAAEASAPKDAEMSAPGNTASSSSGINDNVSAPKDAEMSAPGNTTRKRAPDLNSDELAIENTFDYINFDLFELEEDRRNAACQEDKVWDQDEREVLNKLGIESSAHSEVLGMLMAVGCQTHVSEIFCPPRFTARCNRLGLTPGLAMDLRTGWNFDEPADRDAAWKHLKHEQPYLLIGSPECKAFSQLRYLHSGSAKYAETLKKGLEHLRLVCAMYKYQVEHGRLFLHEHPWQASSWSARCVQEVLELPGVEVAYCDQCMFGMVTADGEAAKKPTGWMSNSKYIRDALSVKCDGGHKHQELIGGRAQHCAAYPPKLVIAVLHALRRELRDAGRLDSMEAGGPTVEEEPPERAWQEFYDEVSGDALDPKAVREARELEVEYMHKLKVYTASTWEEMKEAGCNLVPTRWLDINKGDDKEVIIRSRLVAQETKNRSSIEKGDIAATFAATPPLESVRMLISVAMSGQVGTKREDQRVLGFYDVSRAHFHSPVRRPIFVKPPPEDTSIKSGVARLLKAMYGTRDAGNCFDTFAEEVMAKLGFECGVFSPCIYKHKRENMACVRHGDDFILLATRRQHAEFLKNANELLILKHMGTLGGHKDLGDVQEVRCLNRLIRWIQPPFKNEGHAHIEWELDPMHAEILLDALGLKADAKSLSTPGLKMARGADETPLGAQERELYRSNTMRYAYLAQDRPELQYSSKELARYMQAPTQFDLSRLKRAGRFLVGTRRLVQRFHAQDMPDQVTGFSDSDHAGCLKTRRSTSCTMVFFGKHLIRSTSTTQAVVSLSSGESEFYAAVKTACIGLGSIYMARDMGIDIQKPLDVRVDATAGIGVASRRGAGRIRHIHTPTLWLQRAVHDGRVKMSKVNGPENPADLGTKHVEWKTIAQTWLQAGFVLLQGHSQKALRAALG